MEIINLTRKELNQAFRDARMDYWHDLNVMYSDIEDWINELNSFFQKNGKFPFDWY